MKASYAWAELAGRLLLAAIFVLSGLQKIGGYAATAGYMESHGVPGALLPFVIALEVGGGALVALGLRTRAAALGLAAFALAAAVLFHLDLADPMQTIHFLKNLAIAGGLLAVAAHGAGPLSVDARRAGGAR